MMNRRLREIERELKSLREARDAGKIDERAYAERRVALGDAALAALESPRSRTLQNLYLSAGVASLLVVLSAGLYLLIATRQAASPVTEKAAGPIDHGPDMQTAIAKLAQKLREHPDDAQGWVLLGRTYRATGREKDAREAFQHAVEAAPDDADVARELATPAPNPEESLERDSGILTAGDESGSAAEAPADGITVKVALDASMKQRTSPSDTVFVFAKAAVGPPMPLAVARFTVAQLPTTVKLTDAMGMMPGLKLSQFESVVLGAHVSKSGEATLRAGDPQTTTAAISSRTAQPVELTIDHVGQ